MNGMSTEVVIPVDWIAFELSLQPQAVMEWADRLGLAHHTDESGRACIAEPDGRRIIEEVRRTGREAAELHEAYQRYLDEWDQKRRNAGEEAYQRALLSEHQRERSASMPAGYAFVGGMEWLGPNPQTRAFANSQAE